MDQPTTPAPALDFSTPDAWLESNMALQDALCAVAYAHPAVCSIAARQDAATGECILHVELPRRARKPVAAVPLGSSFEEFSQALAAAIPDADQAASLAGIVERIQPWAQLSTRPPSWALALGETLGLGASRRWDPHHPDGIGRDTPEGIEAFDASCADAVDIFPGPTLASAKAGARFCSGTAAQASLSILADLEADMLSTQPEEPRPHDPHATAGLRGPRL